VACDVWRGLWPSDEWLVARKRKKKGAHRFSALLLWSLCPCALLVQWISRRFVCVTAVEIIAEIEHLPADEQAKVVAFAQHLGERAMLSGADLSKLAGRLADGPHPAEAARLREEIEKGFYGASSHA